MRFKLFLTLFAALFFFEKNLAQSAAATVSGTIRDASSELPIELAVVYLKGTTQGANSNEAGEFSIQVPENQRVTLLFRRVGYKEASYDIVPLPAGARFALDVILAPTESSMEVVIKERRLDDGGMVKTGVKEFRLLPTTTGNLESVLPSIALGTQTGTGGELSSQYNVRGGNYDENLVYVNDFEIYRPQLIRAGQQEGLTFANLELTRDLSFSSGGFQAKYGDKLSSVLDVKYKRPDSTRASAMMSLLGASAHIEGKLKLKKDSYRAFRYLVGTRYKTTKYILGSLDTKGEYTPDFTDLQAWLTYDLSRSWQVGLLANYNRARYKFIPSERETAFGLIDFALKLYSVFEGQEIDDFKNGMTGLSLTYLPERKKNPIYLKMLASRFQSQENEAFDILGYYLLGQIETGLGSDAAGEIVNVLGTGTQQTWVRNYLSATVTNIEHKGGIEFQNDHRDDGLTRSHFLQWGAKFQNEAIDDRINEWERLDSALYSLPFDTNQLLVRRVLKTRNSLNSNRLSGFFQDTYTWRKDGLRELQVTAGVRGQYWDLENDAFLTPRVQLLFKPLNTRRDIAWRLAGGLFYQPAFYRELRRPDGFVNKNVAAQKSGHIVGGFTYDFLWGKKKPVKVRLITEAYYKKMWDLVSYDIDNVRVRYAGNNNATGYATGLDVRLNGEFVKGAESWVNFSLLRTREKLDSIQHRIREIGDLEGRDVKDVPRPTDRLFNMSMFFQDYLRGNQNVRMHLNFTVGTGLPFGLPDNNTVYRNTYRFKPYHRVDIGFSLKLWDESRRANHPNHFLRFTRTAWASLEVFNLMQVANEASKTWLKSVYNTQYGIPNYLTSRRVNVRLRFDF